MLERSGVLENSYVFVMSDHGEMFERGEYGNLGLFPMTLGSMFPCLSPRLVSELGRTCILSASNVDILPTILNPAGREIPDTIDGRLLPGLGGAEESDRSIFIMEAKENSAFRPLKKATLSMIKGEYKIIHYVGYSRYPDGFELYNLRADPEELTDLFATEIAVAANMKQELFESLTDANRPFIRDQK